MRTLYFIYHYDYHERHTEDNTDQLTLAFD